MSNLIDPGCTAKRDGHIDVKSNPDGGTTISGGGSVGVHVLGGPGAGADWKGSETLDANGHPTSGSLDVSADVSGFFVSGKGGVKVDVNPKNITVTPHLDVQTTPLGNAVGNALTKAGNAISGMKGAEFKGADVHKETSSTFENPASRNDNAPPSGKAHDWSTEVDPNYSNPESHYNHGKQQCDPGVLDHSDAPAPHESGGYGTHDSHDPHELSAGHSFDYTGSDHPGSDQHGSSAHDGHDGGHAVA